MGKTPKSEDAATEKPQNGKMLLVVFGDILDTTWRMFIPIVGAAVCGIYVDMKFMTMPWATIVLTVFGLAIAALLVRQQIKGLKK